MDNDIFDSILDSLDDSLKDNGSYVDFGNNGYKAIEFSKDNFSDIPNIDSSRKIVFIDGGNQEIISAPNFSVQLVRVYYTVYFGKQRVNAGKSEFYVLVTSSKVEDKIKYETKIFPINYSIDNFSFDSFDKSLKQGDNRVKIGNIGGVIRKLAEIKVAEEAVDLLSGGDVIVRDGDLKAATVFERDYFDSLYQKARDKGIIVSGLSKTSGLFTDKGKSLLFALGSIAPEGEWYYHPIVDITNDMHKADMYIVKLNSKSDYVFKFEILKESKYEADEILSLLKENSSDPVFFGYPYGLIEADRFARVSNEEIEVLRIRFITKAGDKWKKIKSCLNATNAHIILDTLS